MENGAGFEVDKLLQNVLNNPEMLKNAVELAGKLSENGALSSLFGDLKKESPPKTEVTQEKKDETPPSDSAVLPTEGDGSKRDISRHRKLLQALELYVSDDKRDKLELVIRLLDLWELASRMGL